MLVGTWNHSVEEQTDALLIFRPEGYELPRARGRESMEFKKNGEYIYYQIAPADGYLELKGSFELQNEGNILVVSYTKNNKKQVSNYEIIELTRDILKIRLIDN